MTLKASHAPDSAEEITQIETLTYRRDGEKGNRDMKYGEFPMITREEMTDISMLKDHILYSDEIEDMPKEVQEASQHLGKEDFKARTEDTIDHRAYSQGYAEGKEFDPSRRLPGEAAECV